MRNHLLAAATGTLVLVLTALSGCTASASGTTALFVKDAPADGLSHLYVSFTKAEVHQVVKENKTATTTEDGHFGDAAAADEDHGEHDAQDRAEGNWVTILERNVTVDLKAFSGNASAFLDQAVIPAGTYNAIRLTVSSATAILANGTTVGVKVPGSALRIKGHFTVVDGKETDLTLDFDLAHSLHQEGNGQYILKPVLRLASLHREHAGDTERKQREARRDEHDAMSRQGRHGGK